MGMHPKAAVRGGLFFAPYAGIRDKEATLPKRFHLPWFTDFRAGSWDAIFSHGGSPWDGKFFVEFAQSKTDYSAFRSWIGKAEDA